MPLHGALLISNPRRESMSRVFDNPNWYRAVNLAAGSDERKARRAALKSLRTQYRTKFGNDWSSDKGARDKYEAEANALGYVVGKALTSALSHKNAKGEPEALNPKTGLPLVKPSKQQINAHRAARHELALHLDRIPGRTSGGAVKTWNKTKASAYAMSTKRAIISTKWDAATGTRVPRKVPFVGLNLENMQKYNVDRGARRQTLPNWDQATRKWSDPGVVGTKAMSVLIKRGFEPPIIPGAKGVYTPSEKRAKAKRAKALIESGNGFGGYTNLTPESKKTYRDAKDAGMSKAELKAMLVSLPKNANNNPGVFGGLALTNRGYGGLALTNPGVFGGLALDNGILPFGLGATLTDGLMEAGVGLAGALVHGYVAPIAAEQLTKLPVVGGYVAAVLDYTIPESVPVLGGTGISNTVLGLLAGTVVVTVSQIAAQKYGMAQVGKYGTALGIGTIVVGPALDFFSRGSDKGGLSSEALAGLALDNYGGIAEDSFAGVGVFGDGVFGDGMAYQIGPIVDDAEYGQASLGDAYYSGADFDMNEGEAIVQGRGRFHGRYGSPVRRVEQHGGRSGGASHLAGQPGHRWGWLIKMIGWKNVEQLAKLSPEARVRAIKQLRESALATFKQITVEARAEQLAPSEFSPVSGTSFSGADGVHGAGSSFGSTIFGGQGL